MKPNGEKKAAGNLAKETVKGILTNPIILGIAGGMLLSVCHVPQVTIVSKTVHNLTSLATPLGLMAMGGCIIRTPQLVGGDRIQAMEIIE